VTLDSEVTKVSTIAQTLPLVQLEVTLMRIQKKVYSKLKTSKNQGSRCLSWEVVKKV